MSNKEFWIGWLKNVALVLYCSPELHLFTRLLFLLVRSASRRHLHTQVFNSMLSICWSNSYLSPMIASVSILSVNEFKHLWVLCKQVGKILETLEKELNCSPTTWFPKTTFIENLKNPFKIGLIMGPDSPEVCLLDSDNWIQMFSYCFVR